MQVTCNWTVPFRPHALPIAVRQLTKFGPAPKLENPDKEWHQVEHLTKSY